MIIHSGRKISSLLVQANTSSILLLNSPSSQFSEVNPGLQSHVYVRFEGAMMQLPSCWQGFGTQGDSSARKEMSKYVRLHRKLPKKYY